ncbi:MAG: zinc ribbon domain-containing protein, partial [Muribaculaceae bacterium]|nr:zinc ribbon domain-containing protein [Muribaculaceae bacterium]
MGAFNTKTILNGNPSLIPAIADRICQIFASDGYEINCDDLISGGADISVTKGGVFKAIVGMKTALKITLIPHNNSISFEAGGGI